jgi:hypothetical protein
VLGSLLQVSTKLTPLMYAVDVDEEWLVDREDERRSAADVGEGGRQNQRSVFECFAEAKGNRHVRVESDHQVLDWDRVEVNRLSGYVSS